MQSDSAVRMRLDRVFYPRMRCAISETTKLALARTLDWSLLDFEKAIARKDYRRRKNVTLTGTGRR